MGEKKLCCGRRKPKISPSVSAPLHLILQTPKAAPHDWKKSGGSHFKVCQVCHLTLDKGGIRCKDCGLCAHPHCAPAFPPLTPNPSLLTGTTASIRSSSVPPFEPRIKRLNSQAPPSEHLSSATPIQIIIDEAVDSPRPEPKSPPMTATPDLHPVISSNQHRQPTNKHSLTYVDGPLDGALYALVKPKGPSSADSGISVTVDQMKDLDRLLDALVEDAESIPDIPYHARQDSLPFSYGITHQNALNRKPLTHQPERFESKRQEWTATRQEQRPHFDSTPVYARSKSDDGWRRRLEQRDTSSPPHYATVTSSMETSPFFHSPEPFRTQNVNFTSTPIQHTIPTSRSQTNGQQRLRSASADGRRSEDADAWLKRQMDKLHEKRLAKNQSKRNEWLEELKRTFPPQSRHPSEEVNRVSEPQQTECVRPSSVARVYSRSTASTPAFFSSDDEDFDTEVETAYNEGPPSFYGSSGRGLGYTRKLERVHSDTAFDRMRSSEQSTGNYSTIGSRSSGSDLQRNTPRFPTCPPTPYLNRPNSPAKPPRSPKSTHRTIVTTTSTPSTPTANSGEGDWTTWREEPKSQNVNPRPVFVVESEVKFARDLSCFWYKPNASREETIAALRFQGPGAFVLRNSNSFPGAFGLAIKVDARGSAEETVRHFLIEPTKYGVRLRGSAIEPVFSSLSALVYAHSIEPLALPTTLSLPSSDCVLPETQSESTTAHLLNQGAACQLLFLGLSGVECVTGEDAVSRGVKSVIGLQTPTVVSLRLAKQGLTLTDVFRQRFFRLHFPLAGISYAALDPERRTITYDQTKRRIFGVIARSPTGDQNSCVVLAELEDGQPANAIVSFFQRVIAWNAN